MIKNSNLLVPEWTSSFPRLLCGFTTPFFGNQALTRMSHSSGGTTRENRDRLCNVLGISLDDICSPHQVHGTTILDVSVKMRGRGAWSLDNAVDGDALLTGCDNTLLIISWADCIPVLIFDPEHGISTAIHSGWKGTAGGIVTLTVTELLKKGSNSENLLAAIGPGIRNCCYRVGDEVYTKFKAIGLEKYCIHDGQGVSLDLAGAVFQQLLNAGLKKENIDWDGLCTGCSNSPMFFSCRKDGKERFEGQAAFIGIFSKG